MYSLSTVQTPKFLFIGESNVISSMSSTQDSDNCGWILIKSEPVAFDADTTYNSGDYVTNNNNLYRCAYNNTLGLWEDVENRFSKISLNDIAHYVVSESITVEYEDALSQEQPSTTYYFDNMIKIGDKVNGHKIVPDLKLTSRHGYTQPGSGTDASFTAMHIEDAKKAISEGVLNGSSLDNIASGLPVYFKYTKDDVVNGKKITAITEGVSQLLTYDAEIEQFDFASEEVSGEITLQVETKAGEAAIAAANNVLASCKVLYKGENPITGSKVEFSDGNTYDDTTKSASSCPNA